MLRTVDDGWTLAPWRCALLALFFCQSIYVIYAPALAQSKAKPSADTLFREAFELYSAGQFRGAADLFAKGLLTKSSDGKAHYYYAVSLERTERSDAALFHYREAAKLIPADQEGLFAAASARRLKESGDIADVAQINRLLARHALGCNVGATLSLQGSAFTFYSCAHQCFDGLATTDTSSLDFGSAVLQSNVSAPGWAFVYVPCKNNSACVVHLTGTIGAGTQSCPRKNRYEDREDRVLIPLPAADGVAVLPLVKRLGR